MPAVPAPASAAAWPVLAVPAHTGWHAGCTSSRGLVNEATTGPLVDGCVLHGAVLLSFTQATQGSASCYSQIQGQEAAAETCSRDSAREQGRGHVANRARTPPLDHHVVALAKFSKPSWPESC